MKKIALLTIVQLWLSSTAISQTNPLDSLYQALAASDHSPTRAKIIFEIGQVYGFDNIDSSILYMRQAFTVATDNRLKAQALQQLCGLFRYARPDSTFYYGNLALRIAGENNFNDIPSNILSSLAMTEYAIGNMAQALQFGLQSIRLAEESSQLFDRAVGVSILGNVYLKSGSYDKAIKYFKDALNYFYHNNVYFASANLGFIALAQANLDRKDSAIYYSQLAIDNLPENSTVFYFLGDVLGSTFRRIGNFEKSLEYFKSSIRSTERYISINGNLEIAEIYQSQNALDSALFYGLRARDMAISSGFYSSIIRVNLFLSHLHESRDPGQGIKYAHEAMAYKDSLTAMERSMAIEDYLSVDAQQRQREIEEAKKEFQSRIRMNALMGSTFTMLVVAIILYWSRRQKQVAKQKIELAYDQLKRNSITPHSIREDGKLGGTYSRHCA